MMMTLMWTYRAAMDLQATKILEITGVNSNHLYTCFKQVEKRVPKDILQIARNTAGRKGWIDVSDPNNLRMIPGGENFVQHELPKAAT